MTHRFIASNLPLPVGKHCSAQLQLLPLRQRKGKEKPAVLAGRMNSKDVPARKKAVPRLPAAEQQSVQGIKQQDQL